MLKTKLYAGLADADRAIEEAAVKLAKSTGVDVPPYLVNQNHRDPDIRDLRRRQSVAELLGSLVDHMAAKAPAKAPAKARTTRSRKKAA